MDLWENVRVWNTELENPENTKRERNGSFSWEFGENRDPAHEVSQRNRNSPENWARRHSSHILAKNLNVLSPGLELE
jgi:hypothetical protein